MSLGAGIDTESLFFTKTGNNLILTDGVTDDSVTFTNWYASASNQVVTKLQVVEIASASYNGTGTDALRNKPLEEFNFTSLVSQFNTAGSPANWALSNGMPTAAITSSATAAYGGDLAYYFGLNGNLTGMNLSAAQSTLTNASYATATQTIDSWASISGGPIKLLFVKGGPSIESTGTGLGIPPTTDAVTVGEPSTASSASVMAPPVTAAATDAPPAAVLAPANTAPASIPNAPDPGVLTAASHPAAPTIDSSAAALGFVTPHAVIGLLSPRLRGGLDLPPSLASAVSVAWRPKFGLISARSPIARVPNVSIPERWDLMHQEYKLSSTGAIGGSENDTMVSSTHALDETLVASALDSGHESRVRSRVTPLDRRFA